jgi:hypothetical protein
LQSVEPSTNATYYIIVENLGNVPDTFDLSISSIDNPEILSLDTDNVTLGAGETSARIVGDKLETIKLNVSDTEPGIYRVKVEAISTWDKTVRDSIVTWTIVISTNITSSAIINSTISGNLTITDSIIKNSKVVGSTSLSNVILEDAIVNSGIISSVKITINGITYEIHTDIPITNLVIGSDSYDSNLVGIKDVKRLIVNATDSSITLEISAKDDYFAGSMSVQKAIIPPRGYS